MYDNPAVIRGMERQLEVRAQLIAAGAKPIGWKVGFGAPVAMENLGIDAPLVGFLTDRSLIGDGETVSLTGWTKPLAEPEVAVYMGSDLVGDAGPRQVAAAIAGLGPAIELADFDVPPEGPEAILAGNIYHRRVALAPMDAARAGARLAGLTGSVTRGGGEFALIEDVEANTGALVDLVALVAGTLAAAGEVLRGGDVIIPGSTTPPIFLEPDDTEIRFDLGESGGVTVRFR